MAFLFALVGVVALVLVVLQWAGPVVSATLALFALVIFAHVAGNSLGTRLRDASDATRRRRDSSRTTMRAEPHHFAPATQLSRSSRFGWAMIILTALGAIAGAVGGGLLLAKFNQDEATFANMTLAVVSSGVLGGVWGFALVGFARVFLQAWWEAHRDS